jgi:hypothetical protein
MCHQWEYCHSVNIRLIGKGVFNRQTPENRPLPLKAYTAYTTLLCATMHACESNDCRSKLSISAGIPVYSVRPTARNERLQNAEKH